jgi:hypothetical protein
MRVLYPRNEQAGAGSGEGDSKRWKLGEGQSRVDWGSSRWRSHLSRATVVRILTPQNETPSVEGSRASEGCKRESLEDARATKGSLD